MTTKITIALLTLILGTSAIVMNIPDVMALSYPDVRSDWESHDADDGTKTTIQYKNPSVVSPGNSNDYYWWAKSFTSWGAYAINISEGAVGAGTVKYNPLGGGSAQYVAFVYYWDQDAGSQGWSFGNSISSAETVSVRNTSGSIWERISDTLDSDKTVTGLTWGHSKIGTLQSYATNTMDGYFTSNEIRQTTGWDDFSSSSNASYCEDGLGSSDKEVDKVSGSINNLKFGSSAAANDCNVFASDSIPA